MVESRQKVPGVKSPYLPFYGFESLGSTDVLPGSTHYQLYNAEEVTVDDVSTSSSMEQK